MKKTFDNTIQRAAIRPATARPGRIRFWLKAAGGVALLVFLIFWIQDAYARARADIARGYWRETAVSDTIPDLKCFEILICEIPQ